MRVKRIQNVSHYDLMVELAGGPTVVMRPGEAIEDKDIANYGQLSPFCKAIVEVQEVTPPQVGTGKQYLKG
jgi:hypothetical protein